MRSIVLVEIWNLKLGQSCISDSESGCDIGKFMDFYTLLLLLVLAKFADDLYSA